MSEPAQALPEIPSVGEPRWDLQLRASRVLFGAGRLAELGELVDGLRGRRVLLVSDRGIRKAGHEEAALRSLTAAGLRPFVFDEVEENPTARHVASGVEVATES